MSSTFDFVITGEKKIHCEGCETRISKVLVRLSGVHDVKASAKDQRIVVAVDPMAVGPDQIRAPIEQLGYRVVPKNI